MAPRRTRRSRATSFAIGTAAAVALLLGVTGLAFVAPISVPEPQRSLKEAEPQLGESRRNALGLMAASLTWMGQASPSEASGGATAGKFSTIPTGKRRFYGRVRQGIYQFLQMEKPVKSGDFTNPVFNEFFGKTILLQKGGEQIKGCNFGDCITKEKRTSRWNDFRVASDLLGSAFRYDASDVNDRLPQVKIIRAFAKKVAKLQTAIEEGDVKEATNLYTKAKRDLSKYVPLVELANLDSEDYTHSWDTRPKAFCQGKFCTY